MGTLVKNNADLIVPENVRRRAGIRAGEKVEFKVSSRTITITPVERTYKPTKSELAAIKKGEAEIARGDCVTLNELLHEMDGRRRKVGAKATRKTSR